MRSLAAVSKGSAVAALCAGREDVRGVVHSVFRRAFNVLWADGTLISFAVQGSPNFPSNVVIDYPAGESLLELGITPGQRVDCYLGTFTVGQVVIALAGSSTYLPALNVARPIYRPETVPIMLAEVAECAMNTAPSGDLRHLFYSLSSVPPLKQEIALADPCADSLWRNLCALFSAVADGSCPEKFAHRLLGLGAGLTPAGDDALAGFMVALHFATVAQQGGEHKNQALNALCQRLIAPMRTATTLFSQEMLRFAARGYFTDVAEDLLLALLAGHKELLLPLTARQLSIGASSGIDQLLGMLVGLSAAMGHGPLLGSL